MSITNRDLIVRGYDAFDRGDVGTVLEILDPNIHWHVPGRSPLSGDYKGHDKVVVLHYNPRARYGNVLDRDQRRARR